jgi:eukaryotic-like serine/threonine-protein kinase
VDNQARPGQKPDPDIKVRTLLDRAATSIGGKSVGQPAVEVAIRRTIGETYRALGLYSSSETHLEQSLAVSRRALGDQHRDTLNMIVCLANLYSFQGKYSRAEPLFTAAFDGLRRVHGAEHPDTIRAMVRLGDNLFQSGKLRQAESFLVTTLELARKVLGECHFDTLMTMRHLAGLYAWEGRFAESEAIYTRALGLAQHVRGEDHLTFMLMGGLRTLLEGQDMYARADELSAKVLEGYRRLLGADHFGTLTATMHRARLFNQTGKTTEAEELLTQALAGYRRTLGEDHDYALYAALVRAETYHGQGRLAEAEALFTKTLERSRRAYGDTNIVTRLTMNTQAELYLDEGQPEKAEPLLTKAQEGGASLRDEGTLAAETSTALARVRLAQRKATDAEPLARRALAIREKRHPDHWTRYDALSLVGAALAGQKKYAEAESLLLEGYEGLKQRRARIPSVWRKKRPAEAGTRIIALYAAWGNKEKADEWRKRLKAENADSPRSPETKP